MFYVKEKPVGEVYTKETLKKMNNAASGNNCKETLTNLVAALNADKVDTENCELILMEY